MAFLAATGRLDDAFTFAPKVSAGWLWSIPVVILLGVVLRLVRNPWSQVNGRFVVVALIATFLVGLSEELLIRGYFVDVLAERGLMERKGFPESYDRAALIDVLSRLKSGEPSVTTPVYSHVSYDIVPDESQVICDPDIVIVEGLNVLQAPMVERGTPVVFVSDFFDSSLYVDAPEDLVEQWYVERFFKLRETVFQTSDSYFTTYARLDEAEAEATARRIWRTVNGANLAENILPTRERADVILEKGRAHRVERVHLRRL